MTKIFLNNLQKGIRKAGIETIVGIWEHMDYAERTDIEIICARKGLTLSLHNIAKVLSEEANLLKVVYVNAEEAEKRDLEILATM